MWSPGIVWAGNLEAAHRLADPELSVRKTSCLAEAELLSEFVAVTVSVAGVAPACSVSPASWAGVKVTLPLVTVSGQLLSLSVASDGIPLIVTDSTSSASCGVTPIGSATLPFTVVVSDDGAESEGTSGTGLTVSDIVWLVAAPGPSE